MRETLILNQQLTKIATARDFEIISDSFNADGI